MSFIESLLTTIFTNPVVSFILLVGMVIFVHELGHYLLGRLLGIQVEEFSIGFGSKAFGFYRNGTEYKISWLPIGGYVRFLGADLSQDIPENKKERSISHAPLYKRTLVYFAGPFFNLVLSCAIMISLCLFGFPQPDAFIGVLPESVAERAGLKNGDKVISIEGSPVEGWGDLAKRISSRPGLPTTIVVQRGEGVADVSTKEISVVPAKEEHPNAFGEKEIQGRIGISQYLESPSLVVPKDSLFYTAGLRTGDTLLKVNNASILHLQQANDILSKQTKAKNESEWVRLSQDRETYLELNLEWTPAKTENLDLEKAHATSKTEDVASRQGTSETSKETTNASSGVVKSTDIKFSSKSSRFQLENAEITASLPWFISQDSQILDTILGKSNDKKRNLQDTWQNCGVKQGVSLLAAREFGQQRWSLLLNRTQFGLWLQGVNDSFQKNADKDIRPLGKKTSFWVLDPQGTMFEHECTLQPVQSTNHNLESQWIFDFPMKFALNGVVIPSVMVRQSSIVGAIQKGFQMTQEQVLTIFGGIRKLVTGNVPVTNLGGAISIAKVASDAAESGVFSYLLLMSWISINVGLLNLLPLPSLDGGHLMLNVVEAAYGKPLSPAVQMTIQKVGVIFLMGLMAVVFFNDIRRLFIVD